MADVKKQPTPMKGGVRGFEKPKHFKKSMGKLLGSLKAMKFAVIFALMFACLGTVLSIVGPKIMKFMQGPIEKYLAAKEQGINIGIDMNVVAHFGVILIIVYVASFLFSSLQSVIMSSVTAKVTKNFRTQISEKINRLPLSYFDRNSYGDLLSRVTNDIDTIGMTLNNSLSNLISCITKLIGVPIMMLTISLPLTAIAIGSVPVTIVLVLIIVKISQKFFVKQQKNLGVLNGQIEEIYSAHNIVKTFNGQERANTNFMPVNKQLYSSGYKSQFFSGMMMPITKFVGNIVYLLICVVGAIIAIKSSNPGFVIDIVIFLTYERLFSQPIQQIANISSNLQSAAAATERVYEFLEEPEQELENEKSAVIKKIKGHVVFDNVSFGYTQDKEVIHGLSFEAKPGQKIAIVGPTGAGKTTLVNLLMRFYEINSGSICVDGVDTKLMKREYVRSLFGMVLQDTWLFNGSIRNNLRFGNMGSSDEYVEQCAKKCNIDHIIRTLPGGYEMIVDEKSSLSQGEKQLLTITRAMVQNAPMLILDEATSSVDTRTEELIQDAMDKLMKNRTSFVIAHRLSTIKNADLILVMDKGNVIEQGNHDELMEKNGFYAKLYNSQFSKKYKSEESD